MKKLSVGLISDIHMEFLSDQDRKTFDWRKLLGSRHVGAQKLDLLLVAGDIANAAIVAPVLESLDRAFPGLQKVAVLGNHDYWGCERPEQVVLEAKEAQSDTLQVLDNESVFIKSLDITIYGGTGWFPVKPHHMVSSDHDEPWIDVVKMGNSLSFPSAASCSIEAARRAVWGYIQEQNRIFWSGLKCRTPDIILSHHLPCREAVSFQWQNLASNDFFVSGVSKDALESGAALWAFGHTHNSTLIRPDDSAPLMVSNPYGYPGHKTNPLFDRGWRAKLKKSDKKGREWRASGLELPGYAVK